MLDNLHEDLETIVYADGCRAWRKAADDAGFDFQEVNHSLMQFARLFRQHRWHTGIGCLKEPATNDVKSRLVNPDMHS